MSQIDRSGTFRGRLTEWGVSESSGGYPQFVGRLFATEYYDDDANAYIPWAEYEQDIIAYLVLYSMDKAGNWKELSNSKQLKLALGWDGTDFGTLADGDYSDITLMFRVEEHEYQGNTKLQVQWVDAADANPVRSLTKFDASKLKALTAKFAGVLPAPSITPAKVGKGKPAPTKPSKGKPAPTEPSKDKPSTSAAPAPAAEPPTEPPAEPRTKASTWNTVVEMRAAAVTDAELAKIWIAEVAKIDKAEDEFTSDDWATVETAVLDQVSVF